MTMTKKMRLRLKYKYCPKCREPWPKTSQYWHRDSKRYDGLNWMCRDCANERRRELYRESKRAHLRALMSGKVER